MVQVVGEALGKPVAEYPRDRGVVGTRLPGCQEPSQAGALIRPPSWMELELTPRQPMEIVQARDGLVEGAVVAVPLFEVDCGWVDGEVAEHSVQCRTGVVAKHLASDHQYLTAVEIVEKRRELESVSAWVEVTMVE